MPTIAFFEIPAADMARAREFNGELFQWEFEPFADEQYALIRPEGRCGQPGIRGGLVLRQSPEQQITNYITVDLIDAYVARVLELGGRSCFRGRPSRRWDGCAGAATPRATSSPCGRTPQRPGNASVR